MAKTPIDRSSIDHKRGVIKDQLHHLTATYSDVAYQALGEPENTALLAKRDDLKAQCDAMRADLENLTAAAIGADRNADATKVVTDTKLAAELEAQIVAASTEMEALLPKLVAQIEDVHPLLARYVNLGHKRLQDYHAAMRALGARRTNFGTNIDGHSPLTDAIIGGMVRSGINQIGPNCSPHLIISQPVRVPLLADSERRAQSDRDRMLEALAEARNPIVATTEEI